MMHPFQDCACTYLPFAFISSARTLSAFNLDSSQAMVAFGHDAEVKDGLLFAGFNGTVIACSALLSCMTSSHLVLTSHPSKVHLMAAVHQRNISP